MAASSLCLVELLHGYSKTYVQVVDEPTRESCRSICRRRFLDSYSEPP